MTIKNKKINKIKKRLREAVAAVTKKELRKKENFSEGMRSENLLAITCTCTLYLYPHVCIGSHVHTYVYMYMRVRSPGVVERMATAAFAT